MNTIIHIENPLVGYILYSMPMCFLVEVGAADCRQRTKHVLILKLHSSQPKCQGEKYTIFILLLYGLLPERVPRGVCRR